MKPKLILLLLTVLLAGCIRYAPNVQIRPSAVPEKRLTKTAIAPSSAPGESGSGNDPWKICADLIDSEPVLMRVSELDHEEFSRRVRITYMIRDEAAVSAEIAARCMNGKVYVCESNDQQNCLEKLDFSTEPIELLSELCAQPELDGMIPAGAAIGWNSAYQWICQDGQAVPLRQIAEADAAGYDRSIWKEIPAPE